MKVNKLTVNEKNILKNYIHKITSNIFKNQFISVTEPKLITGFTDNYRWYSLISISSGEITASQIKKLENNQLNFIEIFSCIEEVDNSFHYINREEIKDIIDTNTKVVIKLDNKLINDKIKRD